MRERQYPRFPIAIQSKISCSRRRNQRPPRAATTTATAPPDAGCLHLQQCYQFLLLDDLHGHSRVRASPSLRRCRVLPLLRRRGNHGLHQQRRLESARILSRGPQRGMHGRLGKIRRGRRGGGNQRHGGSKRDRASLLLRRNHHVHGGFPVGAELDLRRDARSVLGPEQCLQIRRRRHRNDPDGDGVGKIHPATPQNHGLHGERPPTIGRVGRLLRCPVIDRVSLDAGDHDLFRAIVFGRDCRIGHWARHVQRQGRHLAHQQVAESRRYRHRGGWRRKQEK
mmetsp:Transcript_16683/g.34817  ORF Transcript_16683/g.34817 Transcript_16683/m.34817 type:complete len:281 (+) Transcript_16683:628-1470(+)